MSPNALCYACRAPLACPGQVCARCSFDPSPLACRHCGASVASGPSRADAFSRHPWHRGWQAWAGPARCVSCGGRVGTVLSVDGGHEDSGALASGASSAGSVIDIEPSISERVDPLDSAHHVPTIRIAIRRAVAADGADEDGLEDADTGRAQTAAAAAAAAAGAGAGAGAAGAGAGTAGAAGAGAAVAGAGPAAAATHSVPVDRRTTRYGLARETAFELSVAEWRALVAALAGPLRSLTEREPWRVDRT